MKWLGRNVGDGGVVLYVDFELDGAEQRRRVNWLARGEGLERVPDSFRYMSALGYPAREAFRVALQECKEHDVKLLILDSLGPALQGDAEAARDVIGFYQKVLEPFRAAGVTVLVIDHQSRLQGGERYQSKSAFGSVFKTNLARSVIQVEAVERKEGMLKVRLRHKKHNFGALATPFEAELEFAEEMVTLEAKELAAGDLAEEQTLNTGERIKLALEDGPMYPEELAETTGLLLKTVKNNLTRLRKAQEVESTGEKDGRSERVRLTVPRPDPLYGDGTRDGEEAGISAEVASFLADPPDWYRKQAATCLEAGAPARLVKPLANAASTHLYGAPGRWREVLPHVRRSLKEETIRGRAGK